MSSGYCESRQVLVGQAKQGKSLILHTAHMHEESRAEVSIIYKCIIPQLRVRVQLYPPQILNHLPDTRIVCTSFFQE